MFRSRTVTVNGELCRLLADAFDPGGEGPVRLSLQRRKRGAPQKISDERIADYVRDLMKSGTKYTVAVEDAEVEFHVKRSKITGACKKCGVSTTSVKLLSPKNS
jgi:hypothetical protein